MIVRGWPVLVVHVGMALVVGVVEQAGDPPQLLVVAVTPRVGAHGGLDAQAMAAQRLRARPTRRGGTTPPHAKPERTWLSPYRPETVARLDGPSAPDTAAGTTRPLMEKFLIHGGAALSGTVVPAGNKNGALPILAAAC